MSKIGNLIYNRRKELGLTLEEVGKAVGVSKSTVKKWENGFISNMRRDKIESLANILQVSPVKLLGISSAEPTISLSGPNTSGKLAYMKPFANTVRVPRLGRVAAGLNCFAEDNIEEYIPTDRDIIKEGYNYFWLTVTGDSMEPELHADDLVLVRQQDTLENECYAVVRIDGEDGVVKRVRVEPDKITLTSVNPYYPVREFSAEDMNNVAIVGPVLEVKRRFHP
jgi:repressor LexA